MTTFVPNPEAVARIPRAIAYRYDALPLNVADGVLTVALAVPTDPQAIVEGRIHVTDHLEAGVCK